MNSVIKASDTRFQVEKELLKQKMNRLTYQEQNQNFEEEAIQTCFLDELTKDKANQKVNVAVVIAKQLASRDIKTKYGMTVKHTF